MTEPVRRGGRGRLPDGRLLTWSCAEGGRGRRWRASLLREGELVASLLLETGLDGRPRRLEVDAAEGLLTLHPGHDDRELHGNVVTATGIRHLAFAWSPAHELVVIGLPLVGMAALARLGNEVAVGEGTDRPAVLVGPDLDVAEGSWRTERVGEGVWHAGVDGHREPLEVDQDGLPAGLEEAETWPLER